VHDERRYIEGLRKEEGIKNSADIHDDVTFEEIKKEIENASYNIDVRAEKADRDRRSLVENARRFAVETSKHFQEAFVEVLRAYQTERRKIADVIIQYIKDKKFDMPQFTVADWRHGKKFLHDAGCENFVFRDDTLLMVFNLPKPLSYFWWKGGEDAWGDERVRVVGPSVIEWGHFYRALMPVIWQQVGFEFAEGTLDFYRINAPGEHDPEKYYYIWEVGLRKENEFNTGTVPIVIERKNQTGVQ